MTKKHFIRLAEYIKQENNWNAEHNQFNTEHIAVLARFCREQNPRFDMDRWLDFIAGKCGPNGGKV